MPSATASSQGVEREEPDLEAIFEPDDAVLDIEAPSAPVNPPRPVGPPPTAGTSKFPWQPAPKMAEPMASALQRAAEEAGQAELAATAPHRPSGVPSAMSEGMGSASAPAPAKEKIQMVVPRAAVAPAASESSRMEVSQPKPFERLVASRSENQDIPPLTFFPGAYEPDEGEESGKTKALVIVAAVVLLASSAGYLSWKNMSGKTPPQVPSTQAAPGLTTPASGGAKTQATAPVTQPAVSEVTIGRDPSSAHATTAKPGAAKLAPEESEVAAEPEPEVTQRIVVRNDTRHLAPSTPRQEQEAAQAPSAVELAGTADTKALANISSAPVNIPKPAPQVMKVSQGVMEGLVLKQVQPRYPVQAMQMRIQGPVQLQATINKAGDITNLKVVSGAGILGRAAQEAVKHWKYKPYYLNGEPVEIQTQILVNFRLPN